MNKVEKSKIKICILNLKGSALYDKYSKVSFGGAEVQLYLLSLYLAKYKNFKIDVILDNYKLKHEIKFGDINLHFSIPLEKKI